MWNYVFATVFLILLLIGWYWDMIQWIKHCINGQNAVAAWILVGGVICVDVMAIHLLSPQNAPMGMIAQGGGIFAIIGAGIGAATHVYQKVEADQLASDDPADAHKHSYAQWLWRFCKSAYRNGQFRRFWFCLLLACALCMVGYVVWQAGNRFEYGPAEYEGHISVRMLFIKLNTCTLCHLPSPPGNCYFSKVSVVTSTLPPNLSVLGGTFVINRVPPSDQAERYEVRVRLSCNGPIGYQSTRSIVIDNHRINTKTFMKHANGDESECVPVGLLEGCGQPEGFPIDLAQSRPVTQSQSQVRILAFLFDGWSLPGPDATLALWFVAMLVMVLIAYSDRERTIQSHSR